MDGHNETKRMMGAFHSRRTRASPVRISLTLASFHGSVRVFMDAVRITNRGLGIQVWRWPSMRPDAEPVVALHGFMDSGRSFHRVVQALDRPVWAPDARGHGASDWVGDGGYYHFYDYIDDVAGVLERLQLPPCGLLAHSMGGSIATALAAAYPERVSWMVLLEGLGPPYTEPLDAPARVRRWRQGVASHGPVTERKKDRRPMSSVEEAAARMMRWNPRLDRDHALELAEGLSEPVGEGRQRVWRLDPLHRSAAVKPVLRPEVGSTLRQLKVPVLSLWGEQSRWTPDLVKDRHAQIARLEVAVLPEAGHNLHHDQPEQVAAVVRWWAGDGPRPSGLRTPPD